MTEPAHDPELVEIDPDTFPPGDDTDQPADEPAEAPNAN